MDAAYADKLDGKISVEFWQRKQAEWGEEEQRIKAQLSALKDQNCATDLADARRILELAQTAHSRLVVKPPSEQAEILRNVLLNCAIDSTSLYPSYRQPFDLIAQRVKSEEWSGRPRIILATAQILGALESEFLAVKNCLLSHGGHTPERPFSGSVSGAGVNSFRRFQK